MHTCFDGDKPLQTSFFSGQAVVSVMISAFDGFDHDLSAPQDVALVLVCTYAQSSRYRLFDMLFDCV